MDSSLERQLTLTHYLRAVAGAAARLTSLLDFDRVLETVTTTLASDFDAALARVWLAEPRSKTLYLGAQAGDALPPPASDQAELRYTALPVWLEEPARAHRIFVQSDLAEDPRFDRAWIEQERIIAVAAFPLVLGADLRGVMVLFSRRPLTDELIDVLASFAAIVTASLNDVQLFVREQEARAEAEEARRRSAFLAEASQVLAGSLDYETTLRSIARLVVPELADWCIVDMVDERGELRRIEVAHSDPERLAMARQFRERYEGIWERPAGAGSAAAAAVIRSGEPILVHELTDEMLEGTAEDEEHLALLRALGLRSYMCVPLTAHGRTRGAITFVSSQVGRYFGASDLDLAQDLARRVAIAVDNARLYQELQEAVRIRDEFLSSVSHDLKNPIAAIKGRAQMLLRRAEGLDLTNRERIEAGLEAIEIAASRMSRIINDLVDVARLRVGEPLELARAPVDLVEVVRNAVAEQQAAAGQHPIVVDTIDDELVGNWDGTRLHRVVTNLISNAIKYSPDGGDIEVRLRCEESARGPWAVIEVHDHGIGIPRADVPRVFERYHRGANVADRFEGTGVGLAAAKQIVEQHGGGISAASVEGQGATFTIALPLDSQAL